MEFETKIGSLVKKVSDKIINLKLGTFNYTELNNKPSINGVPLAGNLTSEDLSIDGSTGSGEVAVEDIADLQSQIDALAGGTRRYVLDFEDVFGKSDPDFNDAATWLATLTPPLTPKVGIVLKNNNRESDTFNHVFTFYTDHLNPNNFIFQDDGVDTISMASSTVYGIIRAGGNVTIDGQGDLQVDIEDLGAELVTNKVTSISDTPTDINYPTEKAVVDHIDNRFTAINELIDIINGSETNSIVSRINALENTIQNIGAFYANQTPYTFKLVETSGTEKTVTKLTGSDISTITVNMWNTTTGDDFDVVIDEVEAGQSWTITTTEDTTDMEYAISIIGVV